MEVVPFKECLGEMRLILQNGVRHADIDAEGS